MGQYVLNTKSKSGSKDKTKEILENRVSKKSRLGFLGLGPKAEIDFVNRKSQVGFPRKKEKATRLS